MAGKFGGSLRVEASVGGNYSTVSRDEEGQQWTRMQPTLPPQTHMEKLHHNYTAMYTLTCSCQKSCRIQVYDKTNIKIGVAAGTLGGTLGGAAIGSLLGSPVPVAGNIIGGVIGGVTGLVGGGVAGYAVSNEWYITITPEEVFQELPQFRKTKKRVFCELLITIQRKSSEYTNVPTEGHHVQ